MMKKLRILVLLCILTFSFSVKAEVLLEIDCNGNEISDNKSITCEGTLLYEKEGINDIEFNYQTNLNIKFSSAPGFSVTDRGNKVSIHTDDKLYDEIMNATKIMEFTLSINDQVNEKENVIISNITINKTSDIKIEDVKKEFNVTKPIIKLDNICTLDSITVEKEKIKDFNKDKLEYRDIKVSNEIIFIDAVRTSSTSSATGLGNVKVPKGETVERKITVTAEDGTIKIYKLYITNITPKEETKEVLPTIMPAEIKSNDNTLKLIEIYNGKKKIDFSFNNNKEIYNIEIDDEKVEKLTIKATLNDNKASFVNNYGPRDIKINYGYNKELIKVISESGDERIITLNINYLDNRNKDNTLLSLKINGSIVNLSDEKLEIKLPYNTLKTPIEAIPNNEKSIIKYEDIELNLGDNEVIVSVTSESGETKEYDINVIREEDKKVFESITINEYDLGFTKNKNEYTLKVNDDTKKLSISINPSDIKYEILGNSNIENGSKIIIKITDDEKSYEYTINIEKDSNLLSSIICYIIFGIGVISLIGSMLYVLKKNKK